MSRILKGAAAALGLLAAAEAGVYRIFLQTDHEEV